METDFLAKLLQQGALGLLAFAAVIFGWSERKARETERADATRQTQLEREAANRAIERERNENKALQTEILRMATETSQINALNRETLEQIKASLELASKKRSR